MANLLEQADRIHIKGKLVKLEEVIAMMQLFMYIYPTASIILGEQITQSIKLINDKIGAGGGLSVRLIIY